MTYTEVSFNIVPKDPGHQILVAQLGELEFESFSEDEEELKAYIQTDLFDEKELKKCQIFENDEFSIDYRVKQLPQQNWNQVWEDSFKPVLIADNCVIRAPFHPPFDVEYEIVIEPKMSFGTGHHATTYMMMQALLEEDVNNNALLDMGCGTGVLAILAEMRGAKPILAIDYDSWCFENTSENISRNNCKQITPKLGSAEQISGIFDFILANINRNILIEQLPVYYKHLSPNGILYLSGFYEEDLEKINAVASQNHLNYVKHHLKNNWVCAKYLKE
jgi:ribosomal protein L11 methyltransferase